MEEKCVWIKRNGEYAFQYITPCVGYSDVENISGFKYCPYCGKKLDLVQEKEEVTWIKL